MAKNTISWNKFFFKDKPLFGLDIGPGELHVMQLDTKHGVPKLKGYGSTTFDPQAIVDNVIVKPEIIARAAVKMFSDELAGDISSRRVAVSLPTNRAFTRTVQLPKMNSKDIEEAVQTEVEQYIPVHLENLYVDYTTLGEYGDTMEARIVAMPKKIIDSYLALTTILGLEAVIFDTASGANTHLFSSDPQSNIPSVLIDLGAKNTDITVFNRVFLASGSAAFGGDFITDTIAQILHITPSEAIILRDDHGLMKGTYQKEIITAVIPTIETLLKEIRRTIRYYEHRYPKDQAIGQIITMGSGASIPGLTAFLSELLHIPARNFDPAECIDFKDLNSFYTTGHMAYVTAAGLAVINPSEIFG